MIPSQRQPLFMTPSPPSCVQQTPPFLPNPPSANDSATYDHGHVIFSGRYNNVHVIYIINDRLLQSQVPNAPISISTACSQKANSQSSRDRDKFFHYQLFVFSDETCIPRTQSGSTAATFRHDARSYQVLVMRGGVIIRKRRICMEGKVFGERWSVGYDRWCTPSHNPDKERPRDLSTGPYPCARSR